MAIQMGKDADAGADVAAGSSATPGTPSRPGSLSLDVSAPHHPHDHPHDRSDDRSDEIGTVARLSTHFDGDEEWIEVEVTDGAEQWTVDVHWRKASTNMMGVRRLVVVKGHRVMVTEGLSSFFEPDEPPPEPPPNRPLPEDLFSPGTFLERLRRRAIGRDWWRVREWMFEQLDAGGGAIDRKELAARAHGYFSGRGGTPIPHAYRMAADLVIEEWQAGGTVAPERIPAPTHGPDPEPLTTVDDVLRPIREELTDSPLRRRIDERVKAAVRDGEVTPTTIDHVLRTHRGELTVSVRFDPLRRDGHPAFTAYPADRDGRGDGHSVVEALGRLAAHLVNEAHANLGALKGEERTR